MAKETVYNNTLVSGAADETLTYTRYVKDESSGKSTKELLDEKVNKTDQLGTTQIADKAVTTEKLENESVTTDKLDAASVTTEKVADANITTSKLADSSVETEKINNKAVTTDKLNDGAVDNSKLSPNAVTSEKIKDESIITEKLNDRAVTTEKVEEKAITNAKLGDQSVDGRVVREASLESKHFSNESVTTEKVARKSITKDKLADNAVDASQVVDGSIDNAKLSPDSVTTEKIKDGSVTNEKIADNTLGIGKFDPELRKTIQAATGLPEDLNQMIQDIDQSVKQLHEKDTDLQSQIDDKQQQITANDEDISLLQARSTQMEETIKSIAATGGASQATAVTYNNEKSKLTAVNIQSAVDEVVDKTAIKDEEGNVQDTPFRVVENEEFIMEVVDSEDKVLFGIYRATGKPYFPLNEMYHVEQNEEFFAVWLDAANHVLFGIRRDGEIIGEIHAVNALKQVISQLQYDFASLQEKVGTIDSNLKELLDVFSLQENTEYLAVEQDAEGKVLSATNPDGSHYIHKVKSETILTQIEEKTDIENRLEMTLDEEEHILSYRDKNGVKHETALGVEHLDVEHFSMKGESIDFSNYATQDDVNGIELKNIDGVYDNSKPNLYLTSQKTYTTADGKQSFTPPNAGAEMSNKIPCKPGEWFTRTGTATGMVVVSDKNDNNAKRLMPNGSLPKASVQVPEYWDWAAYIRFAVATYENNVTINRGKYAVSESSDSVSIPKLKLNVANFTKETKYLKSPNGTFFELSVSDKGVLSVKEIDKDLVAPFDVPSDLKFTISNPSGGAAVFCGNANRVLLHNEKYLYEVKETGLTKFLSIADSSAYFYNVEHQVNSSGKSRIVALLKVDPFKGLCVFDENFILIDQLASPNYDAHDFIYIDDFHYIVYYHSNVLTIDGHMTYSDTLVEWKNGKKIGSYTLNDQDVLRDILFDADVHSTAPIAETHTNTIGFDRTEDRIIVNPRNCCSWIILKRTVSSEDKVTFGPVLEQVGGLPSFSNYGAVARRIKTDSLAQWFLCHDVKYWGMKEISGVSYPTYTLFDNNFLMKENPRNNPTSNPTGATDNAATCSRIVQLSIDWSKRKIVEYKVYVVPSYYSNVMSSAWMMDEGMFCIDYAIMGTIIFADFTTEATTVSEDNHLYTNAKITWKLKQQKLLYRANIY